MLWPSRKPFRNTRYPKDAHPHDIAPAADGGVWYTAQHQAALGWLDPKTGKTRHIPLGKGSAPHGVIVGPDGAAWITDSGLNAIVRVVPRVDNKPEKVEVFPLPQGTPNINLNTATFDSPGHIYFPFTQHRHRAHAVRLPLLAPDHVRRGSHYHEIRCLRETLGPQEGVGKQRVTILWNSLYQKPPFERLFLAVTSKARFDLTPSNV